MPAAEIAPGPRRPAPDRHRRGGHRLESPKIGRGPWRSARVRTQRSRSAPEPPMPLWLRPLETNRSDGATPAPHRRRAIPGGASRAALSRRFAVIEGTDAHGLPKRSATPAGRKRQEALARRTAQTAVSRWNQPSGSSSPTIAASLERRSSSRLGPSRLGLSRLGLSRLGFSRTRRARRPTVLVAPPSGEGREQQGSVTPSRGSVRICADPHSHGSVADIGGPSVPTTICSEGRGGNRPRPNPIIRHDDPHAGGPG